MSGLQISHLSKSFGANQVLEEINFTVLEGEIVVLLGPSGCGKSTLLSIIAGLELPDHGEISWNGSPLNDIPPHKRGFGLMFQEHALFPHRNVVDNVAFGLQMANWPKSEIDSRVAQVLELVGLPDFARREINTLSGGEGQRVALARALAPYPKLLMLDEPLGSLDRNLRERLAIDLKHILKNSSQTALYVTHDHEEAYLIADRIIVMKRGRIEQTGSPEEIYQYPASVFVAKFLGLKNFLPGTIKTKHADSFVETAVGRFQVERGYNGPVTMLLRPDRAQIGTENESQLSGLVEEISFRGHTCQVIIKINHQRLVFIFPSSIPVPQPGEAIHLKFPHQDAVITYPAGINGD